MRNPYLNIHVMKLDNIYYYIRHIPNDLLTFILLKGYVLVLKLNLIQLLLDILNL